MSSNPFAELARSLVQASPRVQAFSALACICRWAPVPLTTGFAREEGALRRDVLTALTGDVTADAIVRLVASHGEQFSVFSEEWETGELDEDTYEHRMLVKFSGMATEAKPNEGPKSVYNWAHWCSTSAFDFSQQLDGLDVSVALPEEIEPISVPYIGPDIEQFEAFEFATQVRILDILGRGSLDSIRQVSIISTAIRDALVPVWAEEFR
jgi:hypothetical protein